MMLPLCVLLFFLSFSTTAMYHIHEFDLDDQPDLDDYGLSCLYESDPEPEKISSDTPATDLVIWHVAHCLHKKRNCSACMRDDTQHELKQALQDPALAEKKEFTLRRYSCFGSVRTTGFQDSLQITLEPDAISLSCEFGGRDAGYYKQLTALYQSGQSKTLPNFDDTLYVLKLFPILLDTCNRHFRFQDTYTDLQGALYFHGKKNSFSATTQMSHREFQRRLAAVTQELHEKND